MNELLKVEVNENQEPIMSARDLHEFLESKERFSKWFDKMLDYGFENGEDYTPYQMVHPQNKQEITDYAIKIDMAKEISMVSKLDKGKAARKYFIQVEKDWNSPEKVMARALVLANKTIHSLEVKLEEAQPMIAFAEMVAESSDTIDMGEMAKLCAKEGIKIGRNRLFEFLRDEGILRQNNEPYQKYIDGNWFTVIETTKNTPYGQKLFIKVLCTGRGQIKIVELVRNKYQNSAA